MRVKVSYLSQTIFEMIEAFLQAFTDIRNHLSKTIVAKYRRHMVEHRSHQQDCRENISVRVR